MILVTLAVHNMKTQRLLKLALVAPATRPGEFGARQSADKKEQIADRNIARTYIFSATVYIPLRSAVYNNTMFSSC